jgi:hypothetical protein
VKTYSTFAGFLSGSTCGLIDFVSHRDVGFNIFEKAQIKNNLYELFIGTTFSIVCFK